MLTKTDVEFSHRPIYRTNFGQGDVVRKEYGHATLATIFTVIIFTLITGSIVDVYSAWEARGWAYRAASSAALRGVTVGRDFNAYMNTGEWGLDAASASAEANAVVTQEMAQHGVSGYSVDIQVLPSAAGGTIPSYPPVARANQMGGDWTTSEASVGVYVTMPVRTFFLHMVNGGANFQVHAFASAGLPH